MSRSDDHMNGDCWPSQCGICMAEEAAREPLSSAYGQCTRCGAIEANLVRVTSFRDLSAIGESDRYPTGYGCEHCS